MTVNFAICDDENKELEYLTSIIDEWGNLICNTVQIKRFSSAESFLFDYEESRSFDILLLDIQMKELDGISLAQKIRQTDTRAQIIFITGFDEYMGKGYDVAALHYLLKPVKKEKLFEVLNKAAENLHKSESYCIFDTESGTRKIAVSDIIYIEAFGHSSQIICKNERFKIKQPISSIAARLGTDFVFCHRSYLVSLAAVSSITKTEVCLDSEEKIPLSRRLYGKINEEFIRFYKEKR